VADGRHPVRRIIHHRVCHLRQSAGVGASADALARFYEGERIRTLIAAAFAGVAALNLLWFAAALRTTLEDAGQGGWGAAAIAATATVGGLFFLLITVGAALSYSIAGSGNSTLIPALNDLAWDLVVLRSFLRAMLVMAWTFALGRARLISNALFAVGVAAVVLVLLGGTTWLSGGLWAPDGGYSRFVSPIIGLAWTLVVSESCCRGVRIRVPVGDADVTQAAFSHQQRNLQTGAGASLRLEHVGQVISGSADRA